MNTQQPVQAAPPKPASTGDSTHPTEVPAAPARQPKKSDKTDKADKREQREEKRARRDDRFRLRHVAEADAPDGWTIAATIVEHVDSSHIEMSTVYKKDSAEEFVRITWRRSHADPARVVATGIDGLPVTERRDLVQGTKVVKKVTHRVETTWVKDQ